MDEIVDKPPSFRGPAVLALTASTSERFPGGAKPIVEHPNGDVPASGRSRRSDGSCSACASLEGRVSINRRIAAEPGDAPASDQGEPEAIDFVRFCYRRRSVGWPELYDEMCAVAGRGLYRGYSADDLSGIGVGLTLFEMPALAAIVHRVVAEDQERRRRSALAIRAAHAERTEAEVATAAPEDALVTASVVVAPARSAEGGPADTEIADRGPEPAPRLMPLAVGA